MIYMSIHIWVADKIDVKFNAMHKLGSSRLLWVVRISVFPEVSQMGYRYRVVPLLVMKVSWNLGKAKVKQDEISITIMLSITHIYIYSVYCNVCYISIPIYYMYMYTYYV